MRPSAIRAVVWLCAWATLQGATRQGSDAPLTPTLHMFAQKLGLPYFASRPWDATEDTSVWTTQQHERAVAGYRIMAAHVNRMYDAGVPLNLGTDAQDPGKAVLSEMLLLHDAGIPMAGVLKIATLNSAVDIGQCRDYGSVEVGKRADWYCSRKPARSANRSTRAQDGYQGRPRLWDDGALTRRGMVCRSRDLWCTSTAVTTYIAIIAIAIMAAATTTTTAMESTTLCIVAKPCTTSSVLLPDNATELAITDRRAEAPCALQFWPACVAPILRHHERQTRCAPSLNRAKIERQQTGGGDVRVI